MHSSYPKFFLNLYNRINLKQQQETIFRKKQGATLKKSINYNEQKKQDSLCRDKKENYFPKKKLLKIKQKTFPINKNCFFPKIKKLF